jgi:crotonobetainyl-CoA:carnitine CoA-transferase CaiB-like acyl-CoA transferase
MNPRLVMVQMPGFSQSPPESERVGFGPTIEQMGGLVALQGYVGGPPHKSGISYGDPTAGIVAAGATVLALLRRERTGVGSHVVVAQRDNIVGMIGEFIAAESVGAEYPVRIGNGDPDFAPHNVYRTRDDAGRIQADVAGNPLREFHETWLAIAVDSDEAWRGLRATIGDPRLDDPRYEHVEGRRAGAAVIDGAIAAWARGLEAGDAAARLQAAGVSAAPVLTPLMLARDAHLEARGTFPTYDHPEAGVQRTVRPVWRLRRRPLAPIRPAPCFGEHNAEVLRDLGGCRDAEIARLAAAGVITDVPLAP